MLAYAILLAALATPMCAADKSPAQRNIMVNLALREKFQIGGRKAFFYEHAKQDAKAVPFYLVPADGTIANPPLHFVLHHAGGSAKQATNEAFAAKHVLRLENEPPRKATANGNPSGK